MEDIAKLIVYKASAGSGKTFTLAVEYIKQLIENPRAYRNILAVTFTNKATAEMKERILSQLLGISLKDPSSDAYLKIICEQTGNTPEEIQKKTQIALNYILHDYSLFRIETIDSFFQSVMRNLARELDLNANLNIELDKDKALSDAVDAMLEKLTINSPVLNWLLDTLDELIEEDKNRNISREIKEFGQNIFNEEFIEKGDNLRKALRNSNFLHTYRKRLKNLKEEILKEMIGFKEMFIRIMEENGLTEKDLKNGRYIAGYFNKMADGVLGESTRNQTINDCIANETAWAKTTDKNKDRIVMLAQTKLKPLLEKCDNARKLNNLLLNSCKLSLAHLNTLQLLSHIREEMQLQNQSQNRFLLSDTNALLHGLLHENDPSFVFEKFGTQINKVMIDEFQDTSSMQWNNFKLLLLEGLSQGQNSLIVGDVKQSIYRWRGGDWNILNNLNNHLGAYPIEIKDLQTNRRSAPFIIQFNNQFFRNACQALYTTSTLTSDELKKAYEKVEQEWIEPQQETAPKGYVQVEFLENTPEQTYESKTLEAITNLVNDLLSKGAKEKDIAILVRYRKKHIPMIANYFSRNTNLTLVSDEAFQLKASPAVCLLIYALQVLNDPENTIACANLSMTYEQLKETRSMPIEELLAQKNICRNLPKEFTDNTERLRMIPLYELLEKLYHIFFVNSDNEATQLAKLNEDAYLLTFFDNVLLYLNSHATDLNSFLQFWEEKLKEKTIPSSEAKGIRILSIHKAKGLEYPHVIIPFCDWKLTNYTPLVWCSTEQEPFNEINPAPISWLKDMNESVYHQNYQNELLELWVDNLNLLYVAFTRAKHNLFILSNTKTEANSVGYLLKEALNGVYEAKLKQPGYPISYEWDKEQLFTFGELKVKAEDIETLKNEETGMTQPMENVLQTVPKTITVEMHSGNITPEFQQSNQSARFIAGNESQQNTYISQGLLLHNIFSHICTAHDVDKVLTEMMCEGVIGSQTEADQLKTFIRKALSNTKVANWFTGNYNLFNECEIVEIKDGKTVSKRPDRVMTNPTETLVVDFKFGKRNNKYNEQVKDYIRLLQHMGYPNVKGYLWYVFEDDGVVAV